MNEQRHPTYVEPGYMHSHAESPGSGRHIVTVVVILIIMMICILTAVRMGELSPTYGGGVDVYALEQDPANYSLEKADGAAHVIVAKNLDKTAAKNVCFSVVFNFRGFDTMGESFILIAALSGSLCILRYPKRKKEKKATEEVAQHE